ncbi:hypothetical protein BSL78_11928 [Apostichopus japonicus]|uniref:Uncharacterized protein n=1 Tax=Stichopus japonicus TaxID=307972 RepID=A0A2G8KT41_STIJA|nr:hypothetical protein BSL78_11928 [Apostichopus japonicus]
MNQPIEGDVIIAGAAVAAAVKRTAMTERNVTGRRSSHLTPFSVYRQTDMKFVNTRKLCGLQPLLIQHRTKREDELVLGDCFLTFLEITAKTFIELESSYVYAFNFSGWAYESRITEMYNNLSDFLQETDQPMVASEFSVQGYDSPRTSSGRHNEILIPVDSDFGEPTCGPTTTEQPTMLPPNGITQCLRNECPTYTERSSLSDRIVIREVSAGVYATKRSTTCNMSAVMDETYMPLRNYFLGSNSERLRIPATVPILQLGVRPERVSASCNFTYQTSFYIPERYQKAPPTPDDETVFISSADAMSYYVLTFEESPTPNIAFSKYTELATFLRESDLCFFPGNFQLAFYDAPWRPLPHRYEVWIPLAKTCGNDVMNGSIEILYPLTEDENLIMPALNGDPTV